MRPGQVFEGRYELEELVGAGGMASVYRAHDRVLERTVALKVLHERQLSKQDVVDRFTREAKLVAGLSHRNIVAVIDRGNHEGRPYIVFEFIDGENLKQLVDRTGPLAVERALELTIEIARALTFAHQKGFVHRDVKPQNVLLNGKGEAKVTDFGIARPLESVEGETQTGTVLGTCDYISPEQAQGERVNEHTDVYSLGVVLYELLTGEVPFTGENFVAVAMQHINAPTPPVTLKRPEVPRRVEAAIGRALAKDPSARFPTMEAFCAELEACQAQLRASEDTGATGVLPVQKPPRGRTRSDRRRRRPDLRPVVLLTTVALAAGSVTLAVALSRSGADGGGSGPPVALHALAAYDPDGDRTENPSLVPLATDGNEATSWSTEHYYSADGSLGKPGVGIILDAGAARSLHRLTVRSSTPGYTALVKASNSPTGGFTDDSASQVAGSSTTFHLDGANARYYLVWITKRGQPEAVHINEVTARG